MVQWTIPCGDWPDITIYRGWLKNKLIHVERLEADFGYRGDRTIDDPETNCSAIEQKRKKELCEEDKKH